MNKNLEKAVATIILSDGQHTLDQVLIENVHYEILHSEDNKTASFTLTGNIVAENGE